MSNLGHVGCRRSLAFGAVDADMDAQDVDVDAEVEVEDAEGSLQLCMWSCLGGMWKDSTNTFKQLPYETFT